MNVRSLLLVGAFAITGCAAQRQVVEIPKVVEVPVAVPCVAEEIPRPALITDRELAAADDYTLVLELAADRLKRRQYEATLEASIAGCR